MRIKASCFLFFFIIYNSLFAQIAEPAWTGTAKGVVRDSLNNYGLSSATLAVYNDSVLLNYVLSNNKGEFTINKLPTGIQLKIIATFVSYKSLSKNFTIDANTKTIDLKILNLREATNNLQEVEIKAIAPVRMNGDTLEFNPMAFQLDPNAVAEDLLKKLPGIIVWGDGKITVNGKEIKSLLVNGKPFFSDNPKIATQNIPKDALDKIQVYRTDFDRNKPFDTITLVNLKLRKEKSFGYFGKINGGLASKGRYESDVSLNIFSPTLQVGIVGTNNNINKVAKDISTIMRNSTFKGVGANTEYQSNFGSGGITNYKAGGGMFQKDFKLNNGNSDSSTVSGRYFIYRDDNKMNKITNSKVAIGENIIQGINTKNDNLTDNTNQNFYTQYKRKIRNIAFLISGNMNIIQGKENVDQLDSVSNSDLGLQSRKSFISTNKSESKEFMFNSEFLHSRLLDSETSLSDWKIHYDLKLHKSQQESSNLTEFQSFLNSSKNLSFNRIINTKNDFIGHNLNIKLGDFYRFLFGQSTNGITIDFNNNISLNLDNNEDEISDKKNDNSLVLNSEISNKQSSKIIDERPSVNISKSIVKQLSGRYQKSFSASLDIIGQLYNLYNVSTKAFQNLNYSYRKFIPQTVIQYSYYKDYRFQKNIEFRYSQFYNYPTVDQLAPIVDNSLIYMIRRGNLNLKPSKQQKIDVRFSHKDFRTKNIFGYNLSLELGLINDNLSDFLSVDSNAVSTISYVNLDNYKYLNLTGTINKVYKLKHNQLQFTLSNNLLISKSPSLIKDFNDDSAKLVFNKNLNSNTKLQLYYSFKDLIAVNLKQSISFNYSAQNNLQDNTFGSSLYVTSVAVENRISKKAAIGSDLEFNNAKFSGLPTTNFLIWNANIFYRFMKENNVEIKFSALDILRQNRGLTNFSNRNIVTQTKVNALQQYFMLSLAYYPRQFGKKK